MSETPKTDRGLTQSSELDDQVQRELEAALGDQSVEQLMEMAAASVEGHSEDQEQKDAGPESGAPGQFIQDVRRGRVTAIRGDEVFVDIAGFEGKHQGIVSLKQFERPPHIGCIMEFVVERLEEAEGLLVLSREGAAGRATWDQLRRGAVVEARVLGTNKGGLELEIVGGIQAFMPAGQVDLRYVDDLTALVGQKLQALVQQIYRRAKRVVLSRRLLLEQRRAAEKRKFWDEAEVGQLREGTVSSITNYGAFVDLGGVDGLVHVSDLSYSHINNPQDVLDVGQPVQVKVLKLEREKNRISLGIKQVAPDPWDGIVARMKPQDQVTGRVVRTTNFGAFVEIESGVDGLLPISEMSWRRISKPAEVVKVGDVLKVAVVQIDPVKRHLRLSLKQAGSDPWTDAEIKFAKDSLVEATVTALTEFGAFCELEPGVEGLVHISELSDRRIGKVEDVLQPGDRKQFRVIDLDPQQRRISLSLKAVDPLPRQEQDKPARADADQRSFRPRTATSRKAKNLKGGIGQVGSLGLRDLRLPS